MLINIKELDVEMIRNCFPVYCAWNSSTFLLEG